MTNKLKPCPFCGKRPQIYKFPKFPKGASWAIQCEYSGMIVSTRHMQSKKEAIEAWNRRAGEEQ